MTERFKIIVVSSVQPEREGLGGALVLHRLLSSARIEWRSCRSSTDSFRQRAYARLFRTRLRSTSQLLASLLPIRVTDSDVDAAIAAFRPQVLLSVVHGWDFISAAAAAKRNRIPLVLLCQDWWPDKPEVARSVAGLVEWRVRTIAARSRLVLCVSEGMLDELGRPPNARVLHDLPSQVDEPKPPQAPGRPYRVIYAGNLYEYGAMLESAAEACMESPLVKLQVFGPEPWWRPGESERLRQAGIYHGLVSPGELLARARQCDAALIAMSFEPRLRRRMRTSFPSKLIEMAQVHIPLIVWGPGDCSAVRWAQEAKSACCVTDPSPAVLRRELEKLAESPSEHARLSRAAATAAATDFNRSRIEAEFLSLLDRIVQ